MQRSFAKTIIFTTFLIIQATPSIAGAISSGGGMVYGQKANPWFLENTKNVSYCISVDTIHFRLKRELIERRVQEAFQAWKESFRRADLLDANKSLKVEPYGQVRLATQLFSLEDCRESTDLRLQFGFLDHDQQLQNLVDPTNTIAATIRTDYDKINMRGRGFIYISPESGHFKPESSEISEDRWVWDDGILLKRVLMHELGHVFGLQHSGGIGDLMGEVYPEHLVLKSALNEFKQLSVVKIAKLEVELNRILIFGFQFPYDDEVCFSNVGVDLPILIALPDYLNDELGIPQNWRCRKLNFTRDKITVYGAPEKGAPWELIGSTAANDPQWMADVVIWVNLPKEQKVFSMVPVIGGIPGYVPGAYREKKLILKSAYQALSKQSKGPILKTTFYPNESLDLEGVFDGKLLELIISGG